MVKLMTKLISLDKDYNIKVASHIEKFLNPDYIYIPLFDQNLPTKPEVKKGSIIVNNQYSSVSGNIIGTKECLLPTGKSLKCLVIANDFKEKTEEFIAVRKRINRLTKEEILKSIYDQNLKDKLAPTNISTIIISGIDTEPYLANENFIQKNHPEHILDTIDTLLNIYKGSRAIIVLKNTDSENILTYHNFLGTYKNIDLQMVDDLYLIGEEQFLIPHLNIQEPYLYFKPSELYTIYTNLKKQKYQTEKYLTITGEDLEPPRVINVKLGSKLLDVFKYFYQTDITFYDIYINGAMQGHIRDITNMIVTNDLNGLVLLKKRPKKEYNCINCGECLRVCPINSNPLDAYKYQKNISCIHCGLCTYICPSYINLEKYLRGEK